MIEAADLATSLALFLLTGSMVFVLRRTAMPSDGTLIAIGVLALLAGLIAIGGR